MLHIGTEKTGSTSIQAYLSEHRDALYKRGILFPQTCGLSCHSRLVAFSKREPDERLLRMIAVANEPETIKRWKSAFRKKHHREVRHFQSKYREKSTVIYSSEHFQSLVRDEADIKRIHSLLSEYYDKLTLVVYLKRQDRMAFSAHNTAVQSGLDKSFSFEDVGTGYYYDHLQMVSNWASVFGHESVRVRVCEKPRLYQGSVVSDLLQLSDLGDRLQDIPQAPASNERLSQTAIDLLLSFNQTFRDVPTVDGVAMPVFRKRLVNHLRGIGDGDSSGTRPSQEAARRFYAVFEASNAELFQRFLGGNGFDESFSEYPEYSAAAQSEVSEEFLHSVIDAVRTA